MNLDIIVNKYLLMWHLLYQSSVSDDIHKEKQKLFRKVQYFYVIVHFLNMNKKLK